MTATRTGAAGALLAVLVLLTACSGEAGEDPTEAPTGNVFPEGTIDPAASPTADFP
ncbi:hypothetical protein [Aquipuribacter sp. SD81]|uniref:hypothetical protein n=1 Tax=Aquipuribacter sp. SD81 TaxID=3127703 RepID=UPI00301B4662